MMMSNTPNTTAIVSMTNATPMYTWDYVNEVFILSNAGDFPRLPKNRLPTTQTRKLVDIELATRQGRVGHLENLVASRESQLGGLGQRARGLDDEIAGTKGFSWTDAAGHTWTIFIPERPRLPFPESSKPNTDSLQMKVLTACANIHCAIRNGAFQADEQEIRMVIEGVVGLLLKRGMLAAQISQVEPILESLRGQLGDAIAVRGAPIRIPATSFGSSGAAVLPATKPTRALPGPGGSGTVF